MGQVERLGALDAAFLALDRAGTPFQVGGVLVFDRAPLADGRGELDRGRILQHIGGVIDRLPRYRQRVAKVPLLKHPVWVDDMRFALERHVQVHIAPKGTDGLMRLVGWLLSEDLPTDRPPWQIAILDDAIGGRVALVVRLHHCLIDGVAGIHLLAQLLRPFPDDVPNERSASTGEPPPAGGTLLRNELAFRARGIAQLRLPHDGSASIRSLAALLAQALSPAADVGINPRRVMRTRAFASVELELGALKTVGKAAGVKLNDVVLTILAGALRAFLVERGLEEASLAGFRAMVPVSTHPPGDEATSGSRVALLLADLPLEEADPRRRLERVHATTRALKESAGQAEAGELLVQVSDVTSPLLLTTALRLGLWRRAFNIVITNIPGPQFPLFFLGSQLRRLVPIVNLWPRQSIGVAVASYDGRLAFGIQADRDEVPDLEGLVDQIPKTFAELRDAYRPREPTRPLTTSRRRRTQPA